MMKKYIITLCKLIKMIKIKQKTILQKILILKLKMNKFLQNKLILLHRSI